MGSIANLLLKCIAMLTLASIVFIFGHGTPCGSCSLQSS